MELVDTLVNFGKWFHDSLAPAMEIFVSTNKEHFQYVPLDQEQPLDNLKVFGDYKEKIEALLTTWSKQQGLSDEQFVAQLAAEGGTVPYLQLSEVLEYKTLHAMMLAAAQGRPCNILDVVTETLDDDIDDFLEEERAGLKPDKARHS
eukprot:GGOE01036385.1.p1 GENE.GGOE01036385.1~~GGOE01036385.1.p1  ORF type:complete len:147 (-),score=17.04 GGOE01036385.1:264-704(-)